MRLVIGVMGTADEPIPAEAREKALRLGRAIARSGCILITGGCPGLPYAAVQGVLTGTGGVADAAEQIVAICDKPTGAAVLYDDEPERLVERLIAYYHAEHYKRPDCFCPSAEPRAGRRSRPGAGSVVARPAAVAAPPVAAVRPPQGPELLAVKAGAAVAAATAPDLYPRLVDEHVPSPSGGPPCLGPLAFSVPTAYRATG